MNLQTEATYLRPIFASDIEPLHRLESSPSLSLRWRFAGEHPSPARYADSLWNDVLFSFVAISPNNEYQGLVTAYAYDARNGFLSLAQVMFRDRPADGISMSEASVAMDVSSLAIEYAFAGWPIRKIYIEATAPNFAQFASMIGRVGQEEGRLRDHVFQNGQWVDLVTTAIYRDEWFLSNLSKRIGRRKCAPAVQLEV